MSQPLPPGQQLVSADKWPLVGERTSGPVPELWRLRIHGRVPQSMELTLDQLQAMPRQRVVVDLHCVTRWSKLGVEFVGVALRDILDRVDVDPAARFVSFQSNSQRGHSSSLSLEVALELGTLIAWEVDGQPLPAEHGGPLRNIVPGRYFYKSVKWLHGLELLERDRLGYWEADAGYHNQADPWREQRYIAADIDKRKARELLATRCFNGLDLRGFQAQSLDLAELQAVGAKLRDANFRGAQLTRADFRQANLSNAHFEGADLQWADFEQADLEGANFCGANLSGCNLREASLFGASFVVEDWRDRPEEQWQAAQMDSVDLSRQQLASLTDSQAAYFRR